MSILVFSRPIRSGKTTGLIKWCSRQPGSAGILMPDENGLRKMTDIRTGESFDAQCPHPGSSKDPLQAIGRFNFYASAFERANAILLNEIKNQPEWLVVDEAGKLEMDKKGFYPALIKLVPHYLDPGTSGTMILVIRDGLCPELCQFFAIADPAVVDSMEHIGR